MTLGVVGRSNERTGLDVQEAEFHRPFPQRVELVRRDEPIDRHVLLRRLQVLPERDDLDADGS